MRTPFKSFCEGKVITNLAVFLLQTTKYLFLLQTTKDLFYNIVHVSFKFTRVFV